MKAYLKLFFFASVIFVYFCITLPLYPILLLAPYKTRQLLNQLVSFYCKLSLMAFNIKLTVRGKENFNPKQTYFIVGNHLSYMDILSVASIRPTCFVTSVEMQETPFLGQICTLAGCLFVERRSRENLTKEISSLADALKQRLNIVVFPEATSTNGEAVLKFKTPLFQAPLAAQIPVLPVTINYVKTNGEKVSFLNRDKLCWYGDMTFFPHFITFLNQDSVEMTLDFHPPIHLADTDYKSLAQLAQETIAKLYSPISAP